MNSSFASFALRFAFGRSGRLLLLEAMLMGLWQANSVYADHIIGSDFTYKCSDTNDSIYEVTYNFYRDCNGCYVLGQSPKCGTSENCNSSQTAPTSLNVYCIDGTSTQVTTLKMTRQAIIDITKTCKAVKSRCAQPCNSSFPYGIEKHVFTGTLDLRTAMKNGCCKFEISALLYVRSALITTGQQQQSFYTSCEINTCKAKCNTSPTLTNDPVAILCCNQPYVFNNGAVDNTDFDSISYQFAPAYRGINQQTSYSGTSSPSRPISAYWPTGLKYPFNNPGANPPIGIYLDNLTGDIIFTPTKCNEIAVVVIEMVEWRKDTTGKYQRIGATRRDMQFIVMTCPGNNPPTITNSKFGYSTCEGEQICFNVTTDDKVKVPPPPQPTPDPDTVELKWNRGIPGATFTIIDTTARLKTGKFCWTPAVGTASSLPYSFTATVSDDACPLAASATRAFTITVKPIAEAERDVDTLDCGEYTVKSTPIEGFLKPAKYTWQIKDSTGSIVFDRKKAYFKSTGSFISSKQSDTIQFRSGGKYIIQHTISNQPNCPNDYYDTLIVPPMLEIDLALGPDTFVCAGTSLKFSPNVTNAQNPVSYYWDNGDTVATRDIQLPNDVTDSSFYVEITDKTGCTAWDSVLVFLRQNPKVTIGPDRRICTYDTIHLAPNDSLAYWDDPRDTFNTKVPQGDTLFVEWYRNNSLFSSDSSIIANLEGEYRVRVVDSLGCFGEDTMYLNVNDTVKAGAGMDRTLCWNDLLTIPATGLDTATKWYQTGRYDWYDITSNPEKYLHSKDTVQYNIKSSTLFRLDLFITEDTTTCFDDDSVLITVNPLPTVKMPGEMAVCCDAGVINLRLGEDANASGGVWSCKKNPSYVSSGYIFETAKACGTSTTSHFVTYTYTHPTTGCVKNDSFKITVNPLPTVELREGYFCQDKQVVNLKSDKIIKLPGNPDLGRQAWNCVDCKTYDWSKILKDLGSGAPGAPQNFVLNIDENTIPLGTKAADTISIEFVYRSQFGCYNRDTAKMAITKVPKIQFAGFPELCWDHGIAELKDLSNVTPADGYWYAYDTMPGTYGKASDLNKALNNGALQEDTLITYNTPEPTYPTANKYYMRYYHDRSGCPTFRDTILTINPLPKPQIIETPLQIVTNNPPYLFCETQDPIDLTATPDGGTWSSPYSGVMVNNQFRAQSAPPGNPFYIHYDFTSIKGCRGADSVQAQIEALPEIEIVNNDTAICRDASGMTMAITANYSNTNAITWIPFAGGSVDNPKAATTNYTFSASSDSVETRNLYVQTDPGNACPFVDDLFTVIINPIPKAEITVDDRDGCNPHTATITTVIKNKIDPNTAKYEWTYSDGNTDNVQSPSHQYTVDGTNTATLKLTSAFGCDTTLSLDIDVYPIPTALFTPDPNNSTTAALPRFRFTNESSVPTVLSAFIDKSFWDFGDPSTLDDTSTEFSPVHFYPADTGTYFVTLRVKTNQNCEDEITLPVIIGPDLLVYIPNAFTPDVGGPLVNEGFRAVVNDAVKDYHMIIFNRWGEVLFETTDKTKQWDGTYKDEKCKPDVYAYYLEVVSWNGETYDYSGTITLIR
ncbi:MAG: gliding motility-associated C-terminal domain-containing protein [Flavobacteriales bacterium]|nr:gliding motility-associated C-terminal domain-containing protein [Flavobacteriales bacterium]